MWSSYCRRWCIESDSLGQDSEKFYETHTSVGRLFGLERRDGGFALALWRSDWKGSWKPRSEDCALLMAKGRILRWLDQGNQRAMDRMRSDPTAGQRTLPYVKSEKARRLAWILLGSVGITSAVFGLLWGLGLLVLISPILWKLEDHSFFRSEPEGDEPNEGEFKG